MSTRCSETYETKTALISLFGIPLWYYSQSPRVVIQVSMCLSAGLSLGFRCGSEVPCSRCVESSHTLCRVQRHTVQGTLHAEAFLVQVEGCKLDFLPQIQETGWGPRFQEPAVATLPPHPHPSAPEDTKPLCSLCKWEAYSVGLKATYICCCFF